jgi:hypothetical protein
MVLPSPLDKGELEGVLFRMHSVGHWETTFRGILDVTSDKMD